MLVCFWEKKQSFWKKVTVFLDKTYLQWKNKTKQKTSYSTELLIEMVNYLMIQIFTPQLKKKKHSYIYSFYFCCEFICKLMKF